MEAVRALYTPGPTAEEAAAFGLTIEEASGPPAEIWPDNLPAINLFLSIATQWRTGMNGATGLDYNVLHRELDDLGLAGEERQRLKADIRIMEDAALAAMREK